MSIWPSVRLEAITKVIRGVTYSKSDVVQSPADDDVPILRAGNINGRLIVDNDLVWLPRASVNPEQLLRCNDVVMCMSSGSASVVGKSALLEHEWLGSFGAFCAAIRTDLTKAEPRFVAYVLAGADFRNWASAAQGNNIKNLNKSALEGYTIPLPPLEEQRRIVGLLDRATEIRLRADAARTKARAIIPALFLDMFGDPTTNPMGWPIRPLGETADFFGGATLPEGIPFTGQEDGYLLCKVSTLALPENSNGIVGSVEWSERPSARSAVAPPGSILFPKRGAAIATNRKRLLIRTGALDPNLMGVRGRPEYYSPGFLLSLFEAFDLVSIASGSTVPQLNKQDLHPLEKMVPPLTLQTSFAEQAQRIEATARALDIAAAKAEAMAVALSAQVFGEPPTKGEKHG